MAEAIQTVYRGHVITFYENGETWEAQVSGGKRFEKTSLAEVKKRIDDFEKQESQFKDLQVYIVEGNGYLRNGKTGDIVTITSVAADGDVWTRDGKDNRSKTSKGSRNRFCAISPENTTKLEVYAHLEEEKAALETKMKDLLASLTRVFND